MKWVYGLRVFIVVCCVNVYVAGHRPQVEGANGGIMVNLK